MSRKITPPVPKPRDPLLESVSRPLIGALTGEDEGQRSAALTWLLGLSNPYGLKQIGGMLIDVLETGDVSQWNPAGASLVGIGPPAIPALILRLCRNKGAALRTRLLGVVGVIGKTLPQAERFNLLMQMNVACAGDHDADVLHAFVMAAGGLGLGGLLSRLASVPFEVLPE